MENWELTSINMVNTDISATQIKHELIEIDRIRFDNDRNNEPFLSGLSDSQIIFYYIHRNRSLNKKGEISKHTVKSYETILQKFLSLAEKTILSEDPSHTGSVLEKLSVRHIEFVFRLISTLQYKKGSKYVTYKTSTISTYMTVIKQFLKWLYSNDFYDNDVTRTLSGISISAQDRPNRDMHLEDIQLFLRLLKPYRLRYAIILCLATTGIRVAALTNIKMEDIEKRTIQGNEYYIATVPEKGNVMRTLLFQPELFDIYLTSRKFRNMPLTIGSEGRGYLFVNKNNEKLSPDTLSAQISNWFKQASTIDDRINPKFTAHFIRHMYAIEQSKYHSPEEIRKALGHASLNTTQIYLEREQQLNNHLSLSLNIDDYLI